MRPVIQKQEEEEGCVRGGGRERWRRNARREDKRPWEWRGEVGGRLGEKTDERLRTQGYRRRLCALGGASLPLCLMSLPAPHT